MNEIQINTIQSLLEAPKKIAIIGHKSPDGDSMGSCLAIKHLLDKHGHTTYVFMPDAHANYLDWLPGSTSILNYQDNQIRIEELLSEIELIFTMDFNSLNRVGDLQKVLEQKLQENIPFVMIDHHQTPDDYAVVTYSDPLMSSTSQMVYHFMECLNWDSLLDKDIATCIYTGILTDTGSFKYRNTTPTTHRVTASLMEAGADNLKINNNIFDANSENRLKLLGSALKNLRVLKEYHTAYITLTQAELNHHHYQKGDTEGFVNYALSIEGVNLAVIFIENSDEKIIKISLRSKGAFPVNQMANKHFHGGGHINAAGGRSHDNMENTLSYFQSILKHYKNDLTYE